MPAQIVRNYAMLAMSATKVSSLVWIGLCVLVFTSLSCAQASTDSNEAPLPPEAGEVNNQITNKAGASASEPNSDVGIQMPIGSPTDKLLHVPITNLFPTDTPVHPAIVNPSAGDPEAAVRGMAYFNQFNCIGCHAPNGGGGMGPSLSNSTFIYGSEPENIYLSILQGRPKGMPAWGAFLPDHIIWDLVVYIKNISKKPSGSWGKTTSVEGFTIEQIPAEYMSTVNPWDHTAPFSYGQAPFEKVKGSPPLEKPNK